MLETVVAERPGHPRTARSGGSVPADDELLKATPPASDTAGVKRVAGMSTNLIVAVVAALVLGAAIAGASAIDAQIADPLAYQRDGNGTVTQVLPVMPAPTTAPAAPPTFSATTALASYADGTASEARPHGVPTSWDWGGNAIVRGLTPPTTDSRFVNLWGQVYTDAANTHPANTRVNLAGCELWRLPATGTTWERIQGGPTSSIDGGAWAEDYSRNDGAFDLRREPDGTQSTVPANGYNSHFWTTAALADPGTTSRAFIAACSARLTLANPSGTDDRASSGYVVSLGIDWRKSDYGCPVVNGITVCNGLGVGRFVRVTTEWRRVLFSTVPAGSSLPAPPQELFRNPDGSYRG
jgi:hypothetical protein